MDPSLGQTNARINDALEHLRRDLSAIRAGRATPSLIEEVPVKAYGSQMKLMELGTISSPQSSLLTVTVWDASVVQDVVKAIQEANLGFNPSNEGQTVRIPIPPLTAERREEFIKLAHTKMEEARIELRQIRQETRKDWEKNVEAGDFGDDEFDRRSKLLQDLVDKSMDQIEQLGKAKTEELQQI